jgi:hypothetical protein
LQAACVEADVTLRFTRAARVWSTRTSLSPALKDIAAELGPVWSQLRKSHYVSSVRCRIDFAQHVDDGPRQAALTIMGLDISSSTQIRVAQGSAECCLGLTPIRTPERVP